MPSQIITSKDGYDWRLPPGTTKVPAPFGSIYGQQWPNPRLDAKAVGSFTWRDLHGTGGSFANPNITITPLKNALDASPIAPLRILNVKWDDLSIVVQQRNPSWEAHGWDHPIDAGSKGNLGLWLPGFLEEWRAFVNALCAMNIVYQGVNYRLGTHPNLNIWQLQYTGSNGLGEPDMRADHLAWEESLDRPRPLTPTIYEWCSREYMDIAIQAIG